VHVAETEDELVEAVIDHVYPIEAAALLERLHSPAALRAVALHARRGMVRAHPNPALLACQRLHKIEDLQVIAQQAVDHDAAMAALERRGDVSAVVMFGQHGRVAAAAVQRVPATLCDQIARSARSPEARAAALGREAVTAATVEALTADDSPLVRAAACSHPTCTNQTLLTRISRQDPDPSVRGAATVRLTDQSALDRAIQDEDFRVRIEACARLADQMQPAEVPPAVLVG